MTLVCLVLLLVSLAAPALGVTAEPTRSLEARRTESAPRIDGVLEEVWGTADSACEFSQLEPECGKRASERTAAYVLYDDRCMYVAFRCFGEDVRSSLALVSDGVSLYLDAFDDDASCYELEIDASGEERDLRWTDDGQWSEQWDGVWRSAVKRYEWGYAVEIVIPFKTLRYRPGQDHWGIDFGRFSLARNETSNWCRHEGGDILVSNMGALTGIVPRVRGLHVELYPVGLVRVEQDEDADFGKDPVARVRPAAGLDLSWRPAPTANLQLTTLPDFAQIEADPYQVNLGRYELWLSERRPFFVEAAEAFGTGYNPLQIFYSRRIGKPLSGSRVAPIWAGTKFTGRFGRYTVGGLGAVTGETDYPYGDTTYTEPTSWFSAMSLRRQVLANSEIGLLYTGADNPEYNNHAAGVDGIFRYGKATGKLFLGGTERNDSLGWGASAEARYRGSPWRALLNLKQISPQFDANGAGYTGWRGQKLNFTAGPQVHGGPVQLGLVSLTGEVKRTWDDEGFTVGGGPNVDLSLRNRATCGMWGWVGRQWELDTLFWRAQIGASMQTDYSQPVGVYLYYNHSTRDWNYRRGGLAPNGLARATTWWRVFDHLTLGLETSGVLEFGPGYEFDPDRDMTLILKPRVEVEFTPKMGMKLLTELVRGYDPGNEREYRSYYASLLYSWTLLPRSTFHVSFSQALDNSSGETALRGRVAVMKVRYLFVL